MQLSRPDPEPPVEGSKDPRAGALRARLSAAACVLLAAGAPARARADGAASNQFEATALAYGERRRTDVVEPTARVTRLFANGQSLSLQLGIDAITGASPTGALPAGRQLGTVQTTTTPSGQVQTTAPPAPSAIPLAQFRDIRGAFDAEWSAPVGVLTPTLGGHFSRERDFQSAGGSGKLSVDLLQRTTTLTVGGGFEYDDVFPTVFGPGGGSNEGGEGEARVQPAVGWVDATVPDSARNFIKRVGTGMVGISQVLTRRWIVGVDLSRSLERGYLTEPYKIVSVMQPDSGYTLGAYKERRPTTRDRRAVLASTVYHFARDVLHLSYRWYQDDWRVRSSTVDLAYRHDLPKVGDGVWVEPHLRAYQQTGAYFYTPGFVQGAPLPAYATADQRLAPFSSGTAGLTIGFKLPTAPGEWTVRAEYIGQIGHEHPAGLVGVQRGYDQFPRLDVGSLVVGYSVSF